MMSVVKRSLLAMVGASCLVVSAQYESVGTFAGNGAPALTDGPLVSAAFKGPYGVCSDTLSGCIYVADAFNHCIRKICDGIVTTFAGDGTIGDADGQGTAARFQNPTGVFFSDGWLYVCDNLNNKIKRIDGSGNVSTVAGSGSWGFQNGPSTTAAFMEPKSLVVTATGIIYVADYENHRIRKIENGMVSTYAGTGIAGDGVGQALSATLNRPRDLCLAPNGDLYFTDLMNNKVKRVTNGGMVELVAGSGDPGGQDGIGANASFHAPTGIDWLSTEVMVVLDAVHPRLRLLTTTGEVTTLAGSGTEGYLDGPLLAARFGLPQDICVDIHKNIYVGDRDNNVIRILTFNDTTTNDTNPPPPPMVEICMPFALPNVFSPDDDGVNDFFVPFEHCQVRALDLRIYNRWGQIIYTTRDPRILWNGRSGTSGDAVPEGVYYYVCLLTDAADGRTGETLTGSLQLLRGRR